MTEVIKKINESGLSPNQFILLYCLYHELQVKGIDLEAEKRVLIEKGHLNEDGSLGVSQIISKELEEQALLSKTREFARLFPPIILPTKLPARGKLSQVKLKLKLFLQSYSYDWDLIYTATEQYVSRYRDEGYKYMQNASNFILDKNGDSSLAIECETLEYSEEKHTDIL